MCIFHVLGTIFYKYTVPCLNDTAQLCSLLVCKLRSLGLIQVTFLPGTISSVFYFCGFFGLVLFLLVLVLLQEGQQEGGGFTCLSGPDFPSQNAGSLPSGTQPDHTGLALKLCAEKLALRELLLQKMLNLAFFVSSSISSELSWIILCLKSLHLQESVWPPSCSPRTVHSGTRTSVGTVCCY